MAGLTFHYRWKWSLQSTIENLWPFISDTDQFRGATGFPPATWTEERLPDGSLQRIGRIRMYGFPIVWQEEPFEWIRHRDLIDVQNYQVGPLRQVKIHIQLEPQSGGATDVLYEVWASPGNILGYPGIPVQIGLLSRYRFGRAFQQIDQYIRDSAKQPFQGHHTPITMTGSERLRKLAAQLTGAGYDAALVARLIDHLQTAPNHELTRMRPFSFADDWHTDRYETLRLFLQATKLGLLDLSWDMLCPECRGAKHQAPHLHDVTHSGYCPSCNINFEVDFARTVEATFQINSAIKMVAREEYCLGSPQNTPHILLQQVLAPGETRTLKLLLEPRQYRWRAPRLGQQSAAVRAANMADGLIKGRVAFDVNTRTKTSAGTLTVRDEDLHMQPAELGAGVVTFTLENQSDAQQILIMEHTQWSDQASTAAEVTSLQSFRDLFSSEALRPGESIGVERMAILFTDLKGSTAMYINDGDAPAFRRVMDHFGILRAGVARNRGALVKTIGDAIMAVFADPVHAVEAATDILQAIDAYNTENPLNRLVLKMGIHQGTCIAVTLNDRLDYFGSVVNLAARLEGQSEGGDVVLSNAVVTDPAVEEYIQQRQLSIASFTANLKGFAESYLLYRLNLPARSVEAHAG